MRQVLRTIALALMAACLGAGGASATDDIWKGFYVDVLGGSVSGSGKGTLTHVDPFTPGVTAATIFASTDRSISPSGGTFALQIGYNYQTGPIVLGVEADMAWVGANATFNATTIDTLTTWTVESRFYSLGTMRGRLGVAMGPVLVYGTAGLAWGLIETKNTINCVGCANPWADGTSKESHLGGVVGAGFEWLIADRFTLKAEYLYGSLGAADHKFIGTANAGVTPSTSGSRPWVYDWDGYNHDLSFSVIRAGVGIKFF